MSGPLHAPHEVLPPGLMQDSEAAADGEAVEAPRASWLFGSLLFLAVLLIAAFAGGYTSMKALVEAQEAVHGSWAGVEEIHHRRVVAADEARQLLLRTGRRWASFDAWETARGRVDAAGTLVEGVRAMPAADLALRRVQEDLRLRPDRPAGSDRFHAALYEAEADLAHARRSFNERRRVYEKLLRRIPTRWVASMMGFDPVPEYGSRGEATGEGAGI